MQESLHQTWPEAFVSTNDTAAAVSRAVKAGKLRKLASRLYTRNLTDTPERIVRRNLWPIVGGYFPRALVADRTALENVPASDGSVCLITERGADIRLPGIVLRPRRGTPPLESDRSFVGGLFLSSTARAFLENMRPSRARGGLVGRTLSRREIEEKLDALIRRSGAEGVNRLRDEIRVVAAPLELASEAKSLDAMIGSLLGTQDTTLVSPAAKARHAGRPFDPDRLALFETLQRTLRDYLPAPVLAPTRDPEGLASLAFFEAYFSNFIEGTEFEVAQAAAIIFDGAIPADRPEDAHDVLGTWRIVSDLDEMRRVPKTPDEMMRLLRSRHAAILERRPEKRPGLLKDVPNRFGMTLFVAPDLVEGTLEQAFPLYRSLETPFQRAVFMMFLIAEVHPFSDGNGRTARIMMNAELVAGGEERIVIPTVYRNNYLVALSALTQNGQPDALIRTLAYAQRWTHAVSWRDLPSTTAILESCNAFTDPGIADARGIRLQLPPI